MIHSVWIPDWRPPTLNKLLALHHHKRNRLKKDCYEMVGCYMVRGNVPKAVAKRRVSAHLKLTGSQKCADVDALWKILLDALVKCARLVDDSAKWCELGEVMYSRVADGDGGTMIILEDV